MKKTKIFFCLLTFLVFSVFGQAFAKTEEEVMRQYDYSSPHASWNSLQQALKNRDLEGALIHNWNYAKYRGGFNSFEEFVELEKKAAEVKSNIEERTRKIWEEKLKDPRWANYLANTTYEEVLANAKEREAAA